MTSRGCSNLDGVAAVRVADVLRLEELCETILSGSPRRSLCQHQGVEALVRGEHVQQASRVIVESRGAD